MKPDAVLTRAQILVFLSWSASWPTNEDYDLYLHRLLPNGKTRIVAGSATDQSAYASSPTEGLGYFVTSSGTYLITVAEYSTTTDWDIELFSFTHDFETHNVPESSLLIPADATGATTLGATYWIDDSIEPFSSQGPTNDGRIKPDLIAPDGVTNTVYGSFYGTSSSAPHAAGAAALLLKGNSLSPDMIQSALEGKAVDLGDIGKDNVFGSGRINVWSAFTSIGIILDDPDAVFIGPWSASSWSPGYWGDGYRYHEAGSGLNTATWTPVIPQAGLWEVYAMWTSYPNRAKDAPYTINHAGGSTTVDVNQEVDGGTWVSLGVYSFNAGPASIELSDDADEYVIADAVKLVYLETP